VPSLAAEALADAGTGAAPAPVSAPDQAKVVDLNLGTEAELLTLPRIGPVVARRIVEYRKAVGPFRSVDELLNVRGVGEKTLTLLRPRLMVSVPPDARASDAAASSAPASPRS
jgi:competence protein ComEA